MCFPCPMSTSMLLAPAPPFSKHALHHCSFQMIVTLEGQNYFNFQVIILFMSQILKYSCPAVSPFFTFLVHGNLRAVLKYLSLKSPIFVFSGCQMLHDSHITCLCFWIVLESYAKCQSILSYVWNKRSDSWQAWWKTSNRKSQMNTRWLGQVAVRRRAWS